MRLFCSAYRVITTEASTSGRPCPSNLIDVKPCPSEPCYSWKKTIWTCDLQGAACGVGQAKREVSCLRTRSKDHIKSDTSMAMDTILLRSLFLVKTRHWIPEIWAISVSTTIQSLMNTKRSQFEIVLMSRPFPWLSSNFCWLSLENHYRLENCVG